MHQPRLHIADVGERALRKKHFAGKQLAGCFGPTCGKRGLERCHSRTLEPHVRLAPLIFVMPIAEPVISKPKPTGIANLAIDYDEANVRSLCGLL